MNDNKSPSSSSTLPDVGHRGRMSTSSAESGPTIKPHREHYLVNCKVCNVPTQNKIRCGVLACEACKKFFLRNFANADSLRCVYGNSECSTATGRAVLTSSGAILRLTCPRCRLAKCFSVGMRVSERIAQERILKQHFARGGELGGGEDDDEKHNRPSTSSEDGSNSNSSNNNNNNMQLSRRFAHFNFNPDCAPNNLQRLSDEQVLNTAVKAASDLSLRFQGLPLMASIGNFNDDASSWRGLMQHLDSAFKQVNAYGNQMPGFGELPAEDRASLVGNAIAPLSATQNFAINSVNKVNLLRHFPEFSEFLNESTNTVTPALSKWKPSTAEYSLLMALLFYQDHPGLSNPNGVREIADQFRGVYQSVVAQQHPNDQGVVDTRANNLAHILETVITATSKRKDSFAAIKARRPDLISAAPLYRKLHQTSNSNNRIITSNNKSNNTNNKNIMSIATTTDEADGDTTIDII